jgi:hypothetical protein
MEESKWHWRLRYFVIAAGLVAGYSLHRVFSGYPWMRSLR